MKRIGPGRVRLRLARMLAERLTDSGLQARFDPAKLYPAQGYWRTDSRADVYRWEGQFTVQVTDHWMTYRVVSWSPMTCCVKGFTYEWVKGLFLEVSANNERKHA